MQSTDSNASRKVARASIYPVLVKLRSDALAMAAHVDRLLSESETDAPAADVYLSLRQVRERGIPDKTARRLLKTGQLEGRRVGREWRVSRASVEAYMRAAEPAEGEDPLAHELGIRVAR